jgi:hypothetical protein
LEQRSRTQILQELAAEFGQLNINWNFEGGALHMDSAAAYLHGKLTQTKTNVPVADLDG